MAILILMVKIFNILSITPKDISIYEEAFTHPSVGKGPNYERLEFLGDAVIELITTNYIFENFPNYPEGKMTKLRALVVSRPSLASFAEKIRIGELIRFSVGERRNFGRGKTTNLSNCFEAVIGAVYRDLGYDTAQRVFLDYAKPLLDKGYSEKTGLDNPKGKLQETLQAIVPVSPIYELISHSGPDHAKIFKVKVVWQEKFLAEGEGSSKKSAESKAAMNALNAKLWDINSCENAG